jgi:hypothetical protein
MLLQVMIDFLFKCYFVYVKDKEERGAAATAFLLSIPLGLNTILITLFLFSLFFNIKEIGGLSAILLGLHALAAGMILNHVYHTKERYKKLKSFKFPALYITVGIVYFLGSIEFFVWMFIKLLESDNVIFKFYM